MRGRGRRQPRRRGAVARGGAGRGAARDAGRRAALLAAERTALNFLGHLSGVATLTARFVEAVAGTGARDPRHPQDDPGPARAGEGGGRRRRRAQPPHRPLRRDPDQGEPHRPRRQPRQGGLRGPQRRSPELRGRGRVPQPRRGRLRARHRRRPLLLDNMDAETLREAVELRDENSGARQGPDAGGLRRRRPRDRPRRSPRPASTFISVGALTHSAPTPRLQPADRAADRSRGRLGGSTDLTVRTAACLRASRAAGP